MMSNETGNVAIDNCMRHYGIKGMKWGRRKKSSDSSKKLDKPRRMSNKELQSRIKRLEMEKKYRELKAAEPKTKTKIQKAVETTQKVNKFSKDVLDTYNNLNQMTEKLTGKSIDKHLKEKLEKEMLKKNSRG